jgi:hypothetical protein
MSEDSLQERYSVLKAKVVKRKTVKKSSKKIL